MLIFLQIVLAVILVLVLAALMAWWGFKRWLRRKMGDVQHSVDLIGDRYAEPARLHLQPAAAEELPEACAELWQQAFELGFRPLGEYQGDDGSPQWLRCAVLDDGQLALALGLYDDDSRFAVLALDDQQHLFAFSNGPGGSLLEGTLNWQVEPGLKLEPALAQLRKACAGRELRRFDGSLLRRVLERAHGRRRDADLRQPPSAAWIEQRARDCGISPTPAQAAAALALARSQWQERLSEAVLEQFQETSRISAHEWERLRDRVQVVHRWLEPGEVAAMLAEDAAGELVVSQLQQQGLDGLELYRQVNQRLPAAQQRECLGELRQPLPAAVYAPRRDPVTAASPRQYHYQAVDEDGRTVHGAVVAHNSADAKQQIAGQGLAESKILGESSAIEQQPEFMFDPEFTHIAAQAAREGIALGVLRALRAQWWLWLPPAVLLAWSLSTAEPFGWGDWLIVGYALLAAAAVAFFVAPMLLYNQLLQSRLQARWGMAAFCLGLLRRLNPLGAIPRHQLELERCKIEIGRGRDRNALEAWAAQQPLLGEEEYQQGLVQLHDARGDVAATIVAQRRLVELNPQEMARIDLALSLARQGEAGEAEDLLAALSPGQLSELALAGYHFARGLLLVSRGQHALAINQFSQAIERASQYKSNPLIHGLLAEVNGYVALALRRQGEHQRADAIWRQVRPLLAKHPSCRGVMAAYEGE